ncbi:MAG: FAD-dependent oxidoreductase [Burkholderiales bacterium]|nr:FAD-dependent oxidoreductase [Burkholderiales bacterium]
MPGSTELPLKVAIIGSGPSGFYAAEALLRSGRIVEVTMIERLPVPYGLVRSGVAPDHPKLKQPILVYDRIARSAAFFFLGNVHVDRDIGMGELMDTHHAVVLACGAGTDRRLGIPGEKLPGSHPASEFVGWYNGHPDYHACTFDLAQEVAVIIGQGNVALDIARILVKPVDHLRHTDIAAHALDALAKSRIREVHIVGRRGPAQAKFTSQELSEIGEIAQCSAVVHPGDLDLSETCRIEAADKMSRNLAKNLETFRRFASGSSDAHRRCYFHFFRNPRQISGHRRVEGVRFARTRLTGEPFRQAAVDTEEFIDMPCGLVFRSIGYHGVPIAGLPFDDARGTIPHRDGRLIDPSGNAIRGLYATGWIKRGATGIIGTNRADSVATVASLLSDLPGLDTMPKSGSAGLAAMLAARGKRHVTYEEWLRIDETEVRTGRAKGKPREKMTRVQEMLAVCGAACD